jgi:GAF domain-containing protein
MSDDLLDLDEGLRALTTLLLVDETLASTLERVTAVATRCVTGGNSVSVSLLKNGSPYTAHANDTRARSVDDRQYELGTGPIFAAISTGTAQASCHGDGDPAWHDLAAHAAACGIHSLLSVPLGIAATPVGTLNIYSDDPKAFGADEVAAATLLAAQAAVCVANVRAHEACVTRIEQLQEALETRVVIEQAKGILMERHALDDLTAFDRLKDSSQHTNVKLRAVAADVVAEVVARSRSKG